LLSYSKRRDNPRPDRNKPAENGEETEDELPNEDLSIEIARKTLGFAQKLTEKILEQSSNKFEILSPTSISAALHLAFLGSSGQTFEEIKKLLGYDLGGLKIS
jgi:serine protease inhibitor